MIIKLSPVDTTLPLDLVVVKKGDVLTVNGEGFDFSPMNSGDTLPGAAILSTWFPMDVERLDDGQLVITLTLPNGPRASPEQRFPQDLVDVQDGPVLLPQPLPEPEPDESAAVVSEDAIQ